MQNPDHNEDAELALAALAEKEGNSSAEQEALEKALVLAPGDIEALEAGDSIGKSGPGKSRRIF